MLASERHQHPAAVKVGGDVARVARQQALERVPRAGEVSAVFQLLRERVARKRIVRTLRESGIDIARRTVAKYREAMRIPSSVQRRRDKQAAK